MFFKGVVVYFYFSGENLHSSVAGKRRIYSENLDGSEMLEYVHSRSHDYSPFITVTVIAVIACFAIAILFTLLFTVLQVR